MIKNLPEKPEDLIEFTPRKRTSITEDESFVFKNWLLILFFIYFCAVFLFFPHMLSMRKISYCGHPHKHADGGGMPVSHFLDHLQYIEPHKASVDIFYHKIVAQYDLNFIKKGIHEDPHNVIYIPKNNTPLTYFAANIQIADQNNLPLKEGDDYTIKERDTSFVVTIINHYEQNNRIKINATFKGIGNAIPPTPFLVGFRLIETHEEMRYVRHAFAMDIHIYDDRNIYDALTVAGMFAGTLHQLEDNHWRLKIKAVENFFVYRKDPETSITLDQWPIEKVFAYTYGFPFLCFVINNNGAPLDENTKDTLALINTRLDMSLPTYHEWVIKYELQFIMIITFLFFGAYYFFFGES